MPFTIEVHRQWLWRNLLLPIDEHDANEVPHTSGYERWSAQSRMKLRRLPCDLKSGVVLINPLKWQVIIHPLDQMEERLLKHHERIPTPELIEEVKKSSTAYAEDDPMIPNPHRRSLQYLQGIDCEALRDVLSAAIDKNKRLHDITHALRPSFNLAYHNSYKSDMEHLRLLSRERASKRDHTMIQSPFFSKSEVQIVAPLIQCQRQSAEECLEDVKAADIPFQVIDKHTRYIRSKRLAEFVRYYTSEGHVDMNSFLRVSRNVRKSNSTVSYAIQCHLAWNLSRLIMEAPPLIGFNRKPTTLFRFVDRNEREMYNWDTMQKGDVFSIRGFLSTTRDVTIDTSYYDIDCLMMIVLDTQPGRALAVEAYSQHYFEREVLLSHGSVFRLLSRGERPFRGRNVMCYEFQLVSTHLISLERPPISLVSLPRVHSSQLNEIAHGDPQKRAEALLSLADRYGRFTMRFGHNTFMFMVRYYHNALQDHPFFASYDGIDISLMDYLTCIRCMRFNVVLYENDGKPHEWERTMRCNYGLVQYTHGDCPFISTTHQKRIQLILMRTFDCDKLLFTKRRRICSMMGSTYGKVEVSIPLFISNYNSLLWHTLNEDISHVESITSGKRYKEFIKELTKPIDIQTIPNDHMMMLKPYYDALQKLDHLKHEDSMKHNTQPISYRDVMRFFMSHQCHREREMLSAILESINLGRKDAFTMHDLAMWEVVSIKTLGSD